MSTILENSISYFNKIFQDTDFIASYAQDECIRQNFVKKYTIENIRNLKIEDYVIGKKDKDGQPNRDTFCYKVEYAMKNLGNISGLAGSEKFGVWVSKDTQTVKYSDRFTESKEPFQAVKNSIIRLLQSVNESTGFIDADAIMENPLVSLFKYKLLFLYYPQLFISIYNEKHIDYFIREGLKQDLPNGNFLDKQRFLIDYKNKNIIMKNWNNFELSVFLYRVFGNPNHLKDIEDEDPLEDSEETIEKISNRRLLDEDIKKWPDTFHFIGMPKEKEEPIFIEGHASYPRNPKVAIHIIVKANYSCELRDKTMTTNSNAFHTTFISAKLEKPYTEAHHLVPLSESKKFNCSLDVEENVVSLCSNCHNCLHYGRRDQAKILLQALYNERKDALKKAGIDISFEKLWELYK